jgi:segregation and condensation protein A
MNDAFESFEEERAPATLSLDDFVVDLEGFEGPLDLLLTLARQQKVDLRNLSILQLAEQYLTFISEARQLRLEIAADYLVMAAWLAYLKSRMLLPDVDGEDEPSGEELAHRLQFQLERLQAMREMMDRLAARDRLGLEVFARGIPEGIRVVRESVWDCSLYDLMRAYAEQSVRGNVTSLKLAPPKAFTMEEALKRLQAMLGKMPDWASLESFLPTSLGTAFERRSAVASTVAATLELVREGHLQLRQGKPFGPIFIKSAEPS